MISRYVDILKCNKYYKYFAQITCEYPKYKKDPCSDELD